MCPRKNRMKLSRELNKKYLFRKSVCSWMCSGIPYRNLSQSMYKIKVPDFFFGFFVTFFSQKFTNSVFNLSRIFRIDESPSVFNPLIDTAFPSANERPVMANSIQYHIRTDVADGDED